MSHEDLPMFRSLVATEAAARAAVERALSGESAEDEDRLIRWIFERGINPYVLFSNGGHGDAFSSFRGIHSLMGLLGHALRDDGDVSFVSVSGTEPKIAFLAFDEPDFRKTFLKELKAQGHSSMTMRIFEPVAALDGVDAFIAEHERKDAECRAAFAEYMEDRGP